MVLTTPIGFVSRLEVVGSAKISISTGRRDEDGEKGMREKENNRGRAERAGALRLFIDRICHSVNWIQEVLIPLCSPERGATYSRTTRRNISPLLIYPVYTSVRAVIPR